MDENSSNGQDTTGTILPININEEMRGSFLDYAMSVIVSRALPDARDGLKPVHRRILYAMYDMGIRPGTSHKKSARIVGEVLGKYHPHGDNAVYDAMARMAQDFSLRYPLVDGQGNFGSQDGDAPAAMRYTEARMAQIAGEMLTDINMETVDFTENYDGSQEEPTVLPARLPNLLLNGTSGIAVGMATSIPPHNLNELINAITYIIDNYDRVDDITVDDLMQFVRGPDFPTGAQIIVGDDLKEAYATGRGRVAMRSTAEIEETRKGGFRLVFTSVPYQISKAVIIERIVSLVRSGRLEGIRDLRDESDREGSRLVVELKQEANPKTVLNRLYKFTQLQSYHSIQMLALVNNEPRTLGLKRCLTIYIEHRYEVIVRRSEHELRKLRARAHILMGLLKAVSDIDRVIRLIRNAPDVDTARGQLITELELTELQANAILDMQLRRLAALERQKLQNEYDEVQTRIEYLDDLLQTPPKILALIREDLADISEKYGDERKTSIIYGDAEFDEADLYPVEHVIISITRKGYIKRVQSQYYRPQRRGGRGALGMRTKEEDVLLDVFSASTHDVILFFTDKGKIYSARAYEIPEAAKARQGTIIQAILAMDMDESVTAMLPVPEEDFEHEDAYFIMASKYGRIKRVHLHEFASVRPSGLIALSLQEGDSLVSARYTRGDQHVMVITADGQSIFFHENSVRPMGRHASGVNAIKLMDGDYVIGMDAITEDDTHMLVVTQNGYGKRTPLELYSVQNRYGMGSRTLSRNERTGPIVAMRAIKPEDEVMLISQDGITLRTRLSSIRESGRATMGVIVMSLDEGDEVVGIAIVQMEDLEDELADSDDDAVDAEVVNES